MPTIDRGWLDQHQRASPPRPHPAQDRRSTISAVSMRDSQIDRKSTGDMALTYWRGTGRRHSDLGGLDHALEPIAA
jgi:hypothetical protein